MNENRTPTPEEIGRRIIANYWLMCEAPDPESSGNWGKEDDYHLELIVEAIQSERNTITRLQGEVEHLKGWQNDVGAELGGDSKQYRNDAIASIRRLKAEVEHEKRRADQLHGRRICELEKDVEHYKKALELSPGFYEVEKLKAELEALKERNKYLELHELDRKEWQDTSQKMCELAETRRVELEAARKVVHEAQMYIDAKIGPGTRPDFEAQLKSTTGGEE